MNKRIKEVAEQVEKYISTTNFEGMPEDEMTYDEIFQKKFAELIVRECMNAVCDPRTTYLESMTESSAMYTARERIRKHFGVEDV